jgi:hypothetical protein
MNKESILHPIAVMTGRRAATCFQRELLTANLNALLEKPALS